MIRTRVNDEVLDEYFARTNKQETIARRKDTMEKDVEDW